MTNIGFIGAGVMGAPMIANLVSAGHSVRGFARSAASRERIAAAGAAVATAADDCLESDVLISMLPDSPDVAAVYLGERGLARSVSPQQIVVDMSTVTAETAIAVHDAVGAAGGSALDAPVSGGEQAAVEGSLSIMVGGEPDVIERVRPLLEAMGSAITHVGPPGSGQLTKAANQLIVATNIAALAEAVVLLESSGIDVGAALTAIGGGLAGSTVLERKRAAILAGTYRPGFRAALHDKDLGIVAAAARREGIALPVTAVVSQLMAALLARGDGELDHLALLKLARELNGRAG
ncbi:2-hydroxy-3-oxopropionate reductase [Beutenbergia cavernae DSM 12333]|uniref:2-hydroxy-3-oxopropionate reductase n=1 Tax=Beutenbergia cavernae (strain ATCC BAA-8 / DSM 12333 / CCUG 43141 / JCM 11478 / NBRC 16432 / NCIMB 13614 / HKI 0122) TaxID=471853 RepID=C5C2V8_BEUC1|nr:NAD(P)-binding domain-containing protein [Beutenbergia cavernae]ACQ81802.1 2-hydroxy-3-oxopropionate reductase [Beutenbergia cavernae DSM 12333]